MFFTQELEDARPASCKRKYTSFRVSQSNYVEWHADSMCTLGFSTCFAPGCSAVPKRTSLKLRDLLCRMADFLQSQLELFTSDFIERLYCSIRQSLIEGRFAMLDPQIAEELEDIARDVVTSDVSDELGEKNAACLDTPQKICESEASELR